MLTNTPKLLTLRRMLIIPLVGQAVLVTGLVTYWSLQVGRQAINDLVLELSQQASAEITQHLDHYLTDARKLSELNAQILSQAVVDPQDLDAVGRFLWQQAQRYDVGYLLWGRVDGRYVDVGRPETYDVDLITEQIDPEKFGNSQLHTFTVDARGNPLDPLKSPIDYPFQAEAWYDQTIRIQKAAWTPLYSWQSPTTNPLAIAFSNPVYDSEGKLLGAMAAEHRLRHVEEFLNDLSQGRTVTAFILEQNGTVIANSHSTETPPILAQALIQEIKTHVNTHLGGWQSIATTQDFSVEIDRQPYFVYVSLWREQAGLNWLTAVVVPESKYLAQINQNMRRTLLLSGGTLLVSLLLNIAIVQSLINTITRLKQSAIAIAAGELQQPVARSRIYELDVFSQAFNYMARQLEQSFVQIRQANDELEQTVALRTAELNQLNQELHHLSATDELTQLANRRAFNQRLNVLGQLRQRNPTLSLALIIADIDYFKPYNDLYGHPQGDRCIQQVAATLQGCVHRATDLVARYGGEEFAILLSDTDGAGAITVAQQCQQAIKQAQIPHERSPIAAQVTLSFGVAYLEPGAIASPEQLLKMADEALYQAKHQGRNSIHVYTRQTVSAKPSATDP